MIPEKCPFSNRQKLKLVLHGDLGVCFGHQEKNDKGKYEHVECCSECPYFDKTYFEHEEWQVYNPYFYTASPPQPQPISSTTYYTTTNNTSEWEYYTYGDLDKKKFKV